ncbi:hypothetical protein QP518_04560 [Peptoniphilus harei]|uniref:hypothetical protein n=1 Tax=Peptoniphilus harei TaxID=54005 RepID=UPI00254E9D9F|nr:hypothetical protein [Peptoniphilus harei]MDK7355015.1 hypothetical protein [Peptoniphilus harei]MDK7370583.1 hypothetical protein [Peptoniphilus harei]
MNDKLNLDSSGSNLEKFFRIMIGVLCFNLLFLIILFLLTLHYKSLGGNFVGTVLAALITVFGVLIGYIFNKKQTYKEIVTRERIEWLHKMQEALAEFLSITSRNDLTNLDKDNLDKARELYYLIISNFNVKEDKEKKNKNERDTVELLYYYANSKELDVQLNFNRNLDSDEDKDSNATKSRDDLEKENKDLKDQIKFLEDTITILKNYNEADKLTGLKRKEIISKYTEIFNGTWNRIKDEAD